MFKKREDGNINSMLELMEANEKYQDESYVGVFGMIQMKMNYME